MDNIDMFAPFDPKEGDWSVMRSRVDYLIDEGKWLEALLEQGEIHSASYSRVFTDVDISSELLRLAISLKPDKGTDYPLYIQSTIRTRGANLLDAKDIEMLVHDLVSELNKNFMFVRRRK